jgi:hypothetical protein
VGKADRACTAAGPELNLKGFNRSRNSEYFKCFPFEKIMRKRVLDIT